MASHADRQPAAQIKIPGLRLVWRPSSATDAKWLLGLLGYGYKGTPRRLMIHLSLRGVLLWGAGAAVAGYFLGTAALAWYWGRNPYNHITYADLVLPTRWSQLKEKRGQGQIDEGINHLRTGKYATGLMLINTGLARKPSHLQARMALAQLYIGMGYLYRGVQLLEDGLDYGTPPKTYLDSLFRLTLYLEDYERVLAIAERIEGALPSGENPQRRRLLMMRATALEKLQRYDDLERLRNASRETPSFAIESAWARAKAARGNPAEVLREIAREPDRFGVPADRCLLQISLAIAARDPAAAEAAIRDWLKAEPTQPQPRIEEIVALVRLGDGTKAQDRLQRFFINFGSDRSAVLLLMKKLTEPPDVAWLKRVRREAEEYGAWSVEMRVLYVQGLILAGSIAEALPEFNLTADLLRSRGPDGGWIEGTQRILDVLTSDSPSNRSQFLVFFRTKRLPPEAFRFALKSLQNAGATELAGELAILAQNRFPALREATSLTNALAAQTKPTEKAGATLSEAQARVELRTIETDIQAGRLDVAFDRLKKVEAGTFPALRSEVLMRRIELHGALDESSQLSAALQLYLSSPDVSQSWLRNLAANWQAGGHSDSAAVVARQTLARFAEAKWATALLPTVDPKGNGTAAVVPMAIRDEAEGRQALKLIDGDLAAGRPQDALQRIKAVERAKIASLQMELQLRRISAHGSLREQIELSAALGYYLSGNNPNLTALRDLAAQWDNASHRDSALSLLRETLAKFPQAKWASDLRKKIEGDLMIAPDK